MRLRNAVGPLVEVCRRLEHDNLPMVRPTMQPLFRDVTDHVRTVQEQIDSLREVLAFAFEASLLVGQAQETAVSKRLASWLAIIAVPTAIAGIYGMNFKNMPELQWEYGYFTVIGVLSCDLRGAVLAIPARRMVVSSGPTDVAWFDFGRAWRLLVADGSKADITTSNNDVRFTPKSGHARCTSQCPLSANSGHCNATRSPHRSAHARLVESPTQASALFNYFEGSLGRETSPGPSKKR